MTRFIVKRFLLLVPVIFVVGIVTFGLARLAPGSPAEVFLGPSATPEQVERLTAEWNLDAPLPAQFSTWVQNALQGNLGVSFRFGEPVVDVFWRHVGPTLSLVGVATLLIVLLGVPAGLAAARRRGTWMDKSSMGLAFVGVSVPEFWLGMLLVLAFAVRLEIFPVSGYVPLGTSVTGWLGTVILPGVTLALGQIGLLARMVRDSVISSSDALWRVSLRARGLGEWSLLKHELKNVAVPALTVVGNSMTALITGAVVVEAVFNIRGIGWLTVNSTLQRDYPLVQGTVLIAALAYILVNFIVDLLYAVVDPRIRAGGA